MVKNKKSEFDSQKFTLILFATLAIGTILFVSSTDIFTLFSVSGLTLDATNSKGKASDRGVDASTGITKNEGKILKKIDRFEGRIEIIQEKIDKTELKFDKPKAIKKPQFRDRLDNKIERFEDRIDRFQDRIDFLKGKLDRGEPRENTPTLPPETCNVSDCESIPTTITVVDLRGDVVTEIREVNLEGGGVASSTTTAQGVPDFIRNEFIIHDRFHTPANGQTVTGSLKIDWGHGGSITVQQFLVPNDFFEWFEVELPQTIRGDGVATFDGISEGEFIYKITVPDDLFDKSNVIPVRLVVNTGDTVVDGFADIEIERPEQESQTFSVAEFFRSLFTEIRIAFG